MPDNNAMRTMTNPSRSRIPLLWLMLALLFMGAMNWAKTASTANSFLAAQSFTAHMRNPLALLEKSDFDQKNTSGASVVAKGGTTVAKGGGTLFSVDSSMFAADRAAGVLVNGRYVVNPTAQNLSGLVTQYGRIGGKQMNGQYMYVINQEGNIIIGTRGKDLLTGETLRMPHPTLIGGQNPQVLGAGMVDIRAGKIYSVNNSSGHFKPGSGSLDAAKNAFSKLPSNVFHKDFQGYVPF